MKSLPWILIIILLIACVAAWFRPHKPLPAEIRTETKIKTVVRVDTLLMNGVLIMQNICKCGN